MLPLSAQQSARNKFQNRQKWIYRTHLKKIKNGVRKTFRRFNFVDLPWPRQSPSKLGLCARLWQVWICFGILLFVTIVHRSISLPLIVLRNAIESHWLSSHSPLCTLFSAMPPWSVGIAFGTAIESHRLSSCTAICPKQISKSSEMNL